jgi:anaerobic ribonucleoside-triphosphate reductase activating protein
MRYSGVQIVFQEIPTEISLAIHITGCPLACPGCHSSDLWNSQVGHELDITSLSKNIERYKRHITCVLYLGGEWAAKELVQQLEYVKSLNLKTALYTGLEYSKINSEIIGHLDYLKYGKYDAALGPLGSLNTNQKLVNLKTNETLNHYFVHGGQHDSIRHQTSKREA